MSKVKNQEELVRHKGHALKKLDAYISDLINSSDSRDQSRADKLAYWIEDYSRFLKRERTFDSRKGIRYKKGDIVKVHLGYRVGREEGGLHFGVVLDVRNSKNNDTITIVPLTSYKPDKRVHEDSVFIGDEVFKKIIGKHDQLSDVIKEDILRYKEKIQETISVIDNSDGRNEDELKTRVAGLNEELSVLNKKLTELEEIRKSIIKMQKGSVALTNQITTVSKIRIFDPVYSTNVLYGIRLSPTTISTIDQKIAELYLSKSSKV
ncbi:type II toxin-antitoxin system PemK/MazF family toxin [Anaerovoracaceae bacterium 41-7]|uniref:type II toxin-antitoxin system PemK/MazF family toxin n=1 Tax=Emergencia sp. JLR.KK010 TaxID=3114296 RepID=UPI0030CC1687